MERPKLYFVYCGTNPDALEESDFHKQVPEDERHNWACFVSYTDYLKLKNKQ